MIPLLKKILQQGLNRYLALDPESKHHIKELDGKIVTIELEGPNLAFQFLFKENQVLLKFDDFAPPDTYIKGSPLTLLHMSFTQDNRKSFFEKGVAIEGDLDLAQDFINLFDRLEIDWEEYASKCIGDVPAHQLGKWIGRVQRFQKQAQAVLLQNVNEYIHEEAEWFPPAEALDDFYNDIDEMRMAVDRIEARVALLKKTLSSERGEE